MNYKTIVSSVKPDGSELSLKAKASQERLRKNCVTASIAEDIIHAGVSLCSALLAAEKIEEAMEKGITKGFLQVDSDPLRCAFMDSCSAYLEHQKEKRNGR